MVPSRAPVTCKGCSGWSAPGALAEPVCRQEHGAWGWLAGKGASTSRVSPPGPLSLPVGLSVGLSIQASTSAHTHHVVLEQRGAATRPLRLRHSQQRLARVNARDAHTAAHLTRPRLCRLREGVVRGGSGVVVRTCRLTTALVCPGGGGLGRRERRQCRNLDLTGQRSTVKERRIRG